jgi:hypothetical protein
VSAYDQLALQCERRGWRLCLCGTYPVGKRQPGLVVNNLAVRSHPRTGRELLATIAATSDQAGLDMAAVSCATALEQQGLTA